MTDPDASHSKEYIQLRFKYPEITFENQLNPDYKFDMKIYTEVKLNEIKYIGVWISENRFYGVCTSNSGKHVYCGIMERHDRDDDLRLMDGLLYCSLREHYYIVEEGQFQDDLFQRGTVLFYKDGIFRRFVGYLKRRNLLVGNIYIKDESKKWVREGSGQYILVGPQVYLDGPNCWSVQNNIYEYGTFKKGVLKMGYRKKERSCGENELIDEGVYEDGELVSGFVYIRGTKYKYQNGVIESLDQDMVVIE